MTKLPKRSKRRKANGKHNGVDLDEQLTPAQVCAIAKEQDVPLTTNALALMRRDGNGPAYYKRGNRVLYPRRLAMRLIESRKPRLIDPAERTGRD